MKWLILQGVAMVASLLFFGAMIFNASRHRPGCAIVSAILALASHLVWHLFGAYRHVESTLGRGKGS